MRRRISLTRVGIAADLLITAIFTVFLLFATSSFGDAVPRPFALAALYGTPAGIAAIGLRTGQRALIAAAAIPLLVGSVIAFSGVSLVFLVPAVLLLVGSGDAAAVANGDRRGGAWPRASLAAVLVIVAGWTILFGFAETRCYTLPTGTGCGSGLISMTGLAVGASLLIASMMVAAWPLLRRVDRL